MNFTKRTYLYDSHKSHQPYATVLCPSYTKLLTTEQLQSLQAKLEHFLNIMQ